MEVVHFVYARSKSEQSSQTNKPRAINSGLFAFIPIAKHIVIVAVLSCMRWKSSAPSRQLHETEPITGKSIEWLMTDDTTSLVSQCSFRCGYQVQVSNQDVLALAGLGSATTLFASVVVW